MVSFRFSAWLRGEAKWVCKMEADCGFTKIAVWCWGWDGAGDLDGPDGESRADPGFDSLSGADRMEDFPFLQIVDPIWEEQVRANLLLQLMIIY